MALDPEKLKKILNKGNSDDVAKFFAGAIESDRRAIAPEVIDWATRLHLNWRAQFNEKAHAQNEKLGPITGWYELMPASLAAMLAVGNLAEINALQSAFRVEPEIAARILSDRRPTWISDYAEHLCDHDLGRWAGEWKQVRALVRAGLSKPPNHDNYVLEALNGIWLPHQRDKPQPRLLDLLIKERDWLETDFWRLFELDGNSEVSLANCDKYGKLDSWSAAIVELSRRGILSRERLLDASLSTLLRDFIQFRSSWFSRFHELLEPTPAERVVRLETYLQLIGSSIPPTVAFAVNAIAIIDKSKPIPARKLIAGLQPALHARGKAVVKEAVKILASAATRDAKARNEICLAALPALLNEATDVQKAVLDLLEAHGDKNDAKLRHGLAEYSDAVAASLKPRLTLLVGATTSNQPKRVSERVAVHKPLNRLDPSRALVPIANLEDLVHLASAVLEDTSNPHDIERVLDGVSRLCAERPDDFASRTGPLRKRAEKKRGKDLPVWNRPPAHERAISMFLISWIDRANGFIETDETFAGAQNHYAFLFRRLIAIARQVQTGQPLPMLSTPTHLGGWIDPHALVERWLLWQKAGAEPDIHEQVLALLRLAPENRDTAATIAKKLEGESGQAVRHALGANEKVGKSAALWLAACRSRQPHGDLPEFEAKHSGLGPDAGTAAKYVWGLNAEFHNLRETAWTTLDIVVRVEPPVRKTIHDALLPVLFHTDWRASNEARSLIRWASLLWPANHEAIFAQGAPRLAWAANYADANDREYAGYLDPLLEPDTELRPMACLALGLALAAEASALRGLAQDALIAAISEDRLDVAALGRPMAEILNTGFNKFARSAKIIREVARISTHHTNVSINLIFQILHGDPAKAPRDISAFLETLLELLSEAGRKLDDATVRNYISALTAGGKTAKLAKQLLALQ